MSIQEILDQYKNGDIELTDALQQLSDRGIDEMGFATIDTDRLRIDSKDYSRSKI